MSTFVQSIPLLHGAVGFWDEIGTAIALVSVVVLLGFLAWSNGNKRRKELARRRREKRVAKGG